MKFVLIAVVVAVLGWFGYQYMNKNAAIDAQNAAMEIQQEAEQAAASAKAAATDALAKAQESMPSGIDLGKISESLNGSFGSVGDAFNGITDVDSASAALPTLEEASSSLSGLGDTIARLPDAAKGPLGSIISSGIATLQPLIEKASAIPGVGDVINPVVTPMLEKLQALAG